MTELPVPQTPAILQEGSHLLQCVRLVKQHFESLFRKAGFDGHFPSKEELDAYISTRNKGYRLVSGGLDTAMNVVSVNYILALKANELIDQDREDLAELV